MMSLQSEDSANIQAKTWSAREQSEQRIRIIIADDQRLFRESIAGILNAGPFLEVVGIASNGREAIELAHQLQPDIVLMDVKMPILDGIDATRQIKAQTPQTRIILLTTFTTDGYVVEGLSAGANGYILKDISAVALVSTIRAVYNGEQVTAPDVTSRMMQMLDRQSLDKGQYFDGLTSREMQMLKLIARGMIAKEIARTLAISEKTVRNHISNIYRKLNIYDRSQVVIYAMKKGLVDFQEA
jgi:NarL family two-component system response regulator LiaR